MIARSFDHFDSINTNARKTNKMIITMRLRNIKI
jgi:hypothetical protein